MARALAAGGQPEVLPGSVTSVEELRGLFSDLQIEQFARDRTAEVRTLSIGGTYGRSEDLQISADLTLSETGATTASGGVGATEATGVESFPRTPRHSRPRGPLDRTRVLDYRRQLPHQWRMVPRLDLSYRDRNSSADYTLRLAPLIRFEYRGWRRGEFEVAAGLDWERSRSIDVSDESTEFVLNLGYRWDF